MMKGASGITHEIIASSGANDSCPVRKFTPALCSILVESPSDIGLSVSQIHHLLLENQLLKISPIHTFLQGHESIHLVPSQNEQVLQRKAREVVVCIHLTEHLEREQVDSLLAFLASRPELTRSGYVKLLDTRKTDSTLIFAIFPLYLACLLSSIMDIALIYLI